MHEPARDGLVAHDAGIVNAVGQAGHGVGQGRQVGGSSNRFQFLASLQIVFERQVIDGLAPARQLAHGGKDLAIGLAVEIAVLDDVQDLVEDAVVEQHRSQDGPLRLQVVRRSLGGRGRVCHGAIPCLPTWPRPTP